MFIVLSLSMITIGGIFLMQAFRSNNRGNSFVHVILVVLGAFMTILLQNAFVRLPFLQEMIWSGPDEGAVLISWIFALGSVIIISLMLKRMLKR